MKKNPFLIVQHMEWEGPGGHLMEALSKRGIEAEVIEAWHRPVPDVSTFAGMIVLGGSPNVDEEESYPYLVPLKEQIRRCIDSGKSYLGFCLGHQLLAHVLGAEVGPNPVKSIGFAQGRLTEEGRAHPLFQGLPEIFPLFKWHSQAVKEPLPGSLQTLARSDHCPVEAVSLKEKPWVIGLQFDNHAATCAEVARWIREDRDWIHEGTTLDEEAVIKEAGRLESQIGAHFDRMFENFLSIPGR